MVDNVDNFELLIHKTRWQAHQASEATLCFTSLLARALDGGVDGEEDDEQQQRVEAAQDRGPALLLLARSRRRRRSCNVDYVIISDNFRIIWQHNQAPSRCSELCHLDIMGHGNSVGREQNE